MGETALKQDAQMEDAIERLKKEKEEWEKTYYEAGKKDGAAAAGAFSYDILQYALLFDPERENNMAYANHYLSGLTRDEELGDYFTEEFSEDGRMGADEDGVLNDLTQQWFEGWKAGVHAFWNEVAHKL
jgi:hypothetical protein